MYTHTYSGSNLYPKFSIVVIIEWPVIVTQRHIMPRRPKHHFKETGFVYKMCANHL